MFKTITIKNVHTYNVPNYTLEFAICTKNMELLKLCSKQTTIFFFAKSSWYLLRSDD